MDKKIILSHQSAAYGPLYNVLVKIDKNVINAAYDLGANGIQTFLRIIFPLSLPGMFSGITMDGFSRL